MTVALGPSVLMTAGMQDFTQAFGLWVGDDGILYVTDRPARMVRRYTTAGAPLPPWGPTLPGGIELACCVVAAFAGQLGQSGAHFADGGLEHGIRILPEREEAGVMVDRACLIAALLVQFPQSLETGRQFPGISLGRLDHRASADRALVGGEG